MIFKLSDDDIVELAEAILKVGVEKHGFCGVRIAPYSMGELVDLLGVTSKTVRALVDRGEMERLSGLTRFLVKADSVQKYLSTKV